MRDGDGDDLDFSYTNDRGHYENGEFAAASSSGSQDGSVSRWSVVASASSSSATMSVARSLSPFEDDAFEKAAAAAARKSDVADNRRHQHHQQSQQQSRKPIDKNGKKVQLIKVLEDFLLSRTKRPRKPRPLDANGRKPILADPLSSLFKPIVDKLAAAATAVDSPATSPPPPPTISGRKRKSKEMFTPPSPAKKKSRKKSASAVVSPAKEKVLVNGDLQASAPTKLNQTLKNHFAKASKAKMVSAKKMTVTAGETATLTVASNVIDVSKKRKRKMKVVMEVKAAAAAAAVAATAAAAAAAASAATSKAAISKQTKEKMAQKARDKRLKIVLNGRHGLKMKHTVRTSATKEILHRLKNSCSEAKSTAATAAAVKAKIVVPELKAKKQMSRKKLTISIEDDADVQEEGQGEGEGEGPTTEAVSPKKSQKAECESKHGKVCQKCEKGDENLIRCGGLCRGMFHTTCISTADVQDSEQKKCDECTTGLHSCFVCKSKDGKVQKCSARQCGKFYHADCLTSFRAASLDPKGTFTCPVHCCLSCVLLRDKKTARKGCRLLRCVRCPVAYHGTESCLAAGSEVLGSGSLLCPTHQMRKYRVPQINVNWCFVCSHGGTLICCETCPASFHPECLNIETPEGSYYCADCQSKSQPKYGDILWVKLGNYRWWPAKVCSPKNVPLNIQSVPHDHGDFAVCFFGTHDYYWTRRSRTFQFLEGDHVANTGATNKLDLTFKKALGEAVAAFQKWKSAKETREASNDKKNNLRPPKYKHLKANRPVGISSTPVSVAEPSASCDCDPQSENPCGPNSECLNRLLLLECSPSTCPAGERCQNQQFVKQQYVKAEIFRAEGKGWGLRSLEDIFKGQFVNEYVGEIIDENECKRRMKKMQEDNDTAYYFLTLDKDRIIDAGKKGNLSRFMNHSCQPNCELRKWTVNDDTRVGLFALTDIPSGTELTFNYNLECLGNEKTQCRCGAPNCSGFIGERPKVIAKGKASWTSRIQKKHALASPAKNKKVLKAKRQKQRIDRRADNYDSECFRCGSDGELLLCDRRKCTKAFHLGCLNLEKTPHGRWECPWHHCDTCGKAASELCVACPNSFCSEHVPKNMRRMSDGTIFCPDHESITEEPLKTDVAPAAESAGADEPEVTLEKSGDNKSNEKEEEPISETCETATTEAAAAAEVSPTNAQESTEEATPVPDLAVTAPATSPTVIVKGEVDDASSVKENGVDEVATVETNSNEGDEPPSSPKSPPPPPPSPNVVVVVETSPQKVPKQKTTVDGDSECTVNDS